MHSKPIFTSIFAFVVAFAVTPDGAAQIPGITPPSIKMGLWEEATTSNSVTTKSRSCITQKSYQDVFKLPPGCTVSNPTQTSSSIDADMSCSMQGVTSSGHISVQIADSGTVHTTMTYSASVQGHTMQGTITSDAHWVGADCGDIPPGASRDVH